ncbi:MAG: GGDEF domain-containing phosphodiesterase [Pseudomonadota bacterium]
MIKHDHKHLNEIPNRYLFIDLIEKVSTDHEQFSVMFMDVMRFSDVSAAFDQESGDQVLLQIVNRIGLIFPDAYAVGRLSGDIFGIVMSDVHTEKRLREHHSRLLSHFKTPLDVKGTAFIADFNVGGAIRKSSETNVNTVISLAEAALRKSKSNRHVNFTVLTDENKQNTAKGLTLKADLTRALEGDELELYFQPKVDLQNYDIIGGECLLRWHHPLDGTVFPGTLLQAAESYNMMNVLGYWTINAAMAALSKLIQTNCIVPISVNLSPGQLYDPNLVPILKDISSRHAVPLHLLEIELTEDVMLSNSLLVKRQLDEIKTLGISLSMDDFGKGYSNLSFIKDLALDAVKIDKAFILGLSQSPVNSAIIKATKIICDAKQCETFVEGIETIEQLAILKSMGITKGQGFLFSQAVPIDSFIEQLMIGNFEAEVNKCAELRKKVKV